MRARLVYAGAALATIVVGLLVHTGTALPPGPKDIAGDALWAMMVVWWVSAIAPGRALPARAAVALGIAWTVELTQRYHAPWIDSLRSLRAVHLVLGSDFDARDLLSYAAGIVTAALIELGCRVYLRAVHAH